MKSKFLNILRERNFIQDCTDFDGVDEYLKECEDSGEPAIAYIGFDCTAESLHAGSLLQIMALRWFQKCGHKPIILLGGGTTKIGDPSGKDESRKILTDEQIEKNKAGIKKVFKKFIKFGDDANDAILVDNDEWLSGSNFIHFLREVGSYFTINKMVTMESVKRRLEGDNDMTFLEFNYMVMQAYDFCELANRYKCRLQIGGSDQWGNIVNGTELWRKKYIKEQMDNSDFRSEGKIEKRRKYGIFGLTTPLLTTSSGAKMGKTADGAIWLDEKLLSPYDYWQYWRNVDDDDVGRFLKYFTDLDIEEIKKDEEVEGAAINEVKVKLATEVTKMLYRENPNIIDEIIETAKKVFEQGGIGEDLPTLQVNQIHLDQGIPAMELFVGSGLAESNGEVKRLVKGGGAKVNDKKLNNHADLIDSSFLNDGKIKLSAGKKKHAVVEVA